MIMKYLLKFLMLTIIAIFKPWRDLFESTKTDISMKYLFRRKTLQYHLDNEFKDNKPVQYFFKFLYLLSLFATIILNASLYLPRVLIGGNKQSSKKSDWIELTPIVGYDTRFYQPKHILGPRLIKQIDEAKIDEALDSSSKYLSDTIRDSKDAVNVFRYCPI
jgi:hypothetical protein